MDVDGFELGRQSTQFAPELLAKLSGVRSPPADYSNSALTPNALAVVTRARSKVRTLAPWLYAMARCRASPARSPVVYWSEKRPAVWKSRLETGSTFK